MFPKTQVIVNPESNKGRTRKRWETIKKALQAFLKEFKYEFTEKPYQAAEISRAAIKEGSELIVGVGGDGTMNEIANGFFENREPINPETALGIVPSGTGSDFSRSLHIPQGTKSAVSVLLRAPSTLIDVGRATFVSHHGVKEDRYFINVSDFGIGGEVVHRMNQRRMQRKASSYFRSLVSTFLRYKNKRLNIFIDGKEVPDHDFMIGAIANGRIFGKGMKVAPEANLTDGLFDVVLVKGMRLLEFLKNVRKLYSGTHLSHPKIALIRGRIVDAVPCAEEKDVLIELDGEQLGKLPARFELLPRCLSVKGYL